MLVDVFIIIGAVITTTFYAAYLGKQLLLRRKGIRSYRLGKGVKQLGTKMVETALIIVTLLMPFAQYASILTGNGLLPLVQSTPDFMKFAGSVIAFAGLLYFLCAMSAMRDNWRAGIDFSQKTEFVSRGIYRFSRNPAFVGFDLFYCGIAIMFPSLLLTLLTLAAVILFHMQILEEEKYLSATFGAEYEEYVKNTLRY